MVIIQPVHSVVSTGFPTLRHGFHRVFHMVADCRCALMVWQNGHLALGKGIDDNGQEGDLCSYCETLLVDQYGYAMLRSIVPMAR